MDRLRTVAIPWKALLQVGAERELMARQIDLVANSSGIGPVPLEVLACVLLTNEVVGGPAMSSPSGLPTQSLLVPDRPS